MTNHSQHVVMPSAFPLVYGMAFIATLVRAFIDFQSSGLPLHIKQALIEPQDQSAAWTSLTVFAFVVSIYVFVLYLRLELFEHKPLLPRIAYMTQRWRRLEFALRVLIVTLITLKLARWSDFASLLMFHLFLTLLFCLWMFHLRSAAHQASHLRAITYLALPLFTFLLILFEEGHVSAVLTLQLMLFPLIATIAIAAYEAYDLFGLLKSQLIDFFRAM